MLNSVNTIAARLISVARFAVLLVGVGLLSSCGDEEPVPAPASSAASQPAAADELVAARGRGIVGSRHDFSDAGRVPRDLCAPCHTPHITAAQAPLLVSRAGGADTTRSYQNRAGQLDAASLVCLSCHDGTVARDVYAGAHAADWSERSAGDLPPGRSRLTNHPVGVTYPDAEPGYNSAAAVTRGGVFKLPGGRIQCTTCHDPHNAQGVPKMLVTSNERSRLCLTCHRL